MEIRADLHVHSNYSFDSRSKVKRILKKAQKEKIDVIAITDHEEIDGAEELSNLTKDILVIKGEEIDTEYGDIIGLFLKHKVKSNKFMEAISEIKSQEGIVVVPHPAVYHILVKKVLDEIDLIEGFNARIGSESNRMAMKLAEEIKKPAVAGSDAHFIFEIGNGVTLIDSKSKDLEDIKKALLKGDFVICPRHFSKIKRLFVRLSKVWRRRK